MEKGKQNKFIFPGLRFYLLYSFFQNEPMKFFFKITDINLVTDRFDHLEPFVSPEVIKKPTRTVKLNLDKDKSVKITKKSEVVNVDKDISKPSHASDKKPEKELLKRENRVTPIIGCKEKDSIEKEITEEIKSRIQNEPASDKNAIYTNITLNRSNNVEIITKIQKVSNKNGQPIGLNIIKQTVKKTKPPPSVDHKKTQENLPKLTVKPVSNEKISLPQKIKLLDKGNAKEVNKQAVSQTVVNSIRPEVAPAGSSSAASVVASEEDEKSIFLKSIELTAKNTVKPMVSQKSDLAKSTAELTKPGMPQKVELPKVVSPHKRKSPSPHKTERPPAKKLKTAKNEKKQNIGIVKPGIKSKAIQNPAVRQMVTNVNQNATNLNRIVEQNSPNATTSKELKSLFEGCKINIPSSLSITLKESSDDDRDRRLLAAAKPVQNYIEILKLPDVVNVKDASSSLGMHHVLAHERVGTPQVTLIDSKSDNSAQKENMPKPSISTATNPISSPSITVKASSCATSSQNTPTTNSVFSKPAAILPCPVPHVSPKALNSSRDNLVKLNPRSPQTFQKMFEEAIKKPDFSNKFQTVATAKKEGKSALEKKPEKSALDLTVNESNSGTGGNKRNILEIASQLYKKTKLEQEKNGTMAGTENNVDCKVPPGKVAIPRLSHQKLVKTTPVVQKPTKGESKSPVTSVDCHSSSLGINYTVSVGQNGSRVLSPQQTETKSIPSVPKAAPGSVSSTSECKTDLECGGVSTTVPAVSPKISVSPKLLSSPKSSPKTPSSQESLRLNTPPSCSPKPPPFSPKSSKSPTGKPISNKTSSNFSVSTTSAPFNASLSPNQILEKYNIQNLAQLTASFNFSPANFVANPANQLAALQQAVILKHFEMQNRQNWLNMNPSPLIQYQKYLQSLSQGQNHLLGNIKEN